jgi:hypothetical protein
MDCTGQGFTTDGSGVGPDLRERNLAQQMTKAG